MNLAVFSKSIFLIQYWDMYAAVLGSYLITEELQGITLSSRRHTGAIKVFEKTGALLKLKQVMGHNDMKV